MTHPRPSEAAFSDLSLGDPRITLLSLDEELVLAILEWLTARPLCAIALVCNRFARPATFGHADGQRLSLPERAAQRILEREQLAGRARAYQRGPTEPYRQILVLLERKLLAPGVLHDVPFGALAGSGWKLAYRKPYSHRTSDSDLDKVPPAARYVLAAAYHAGGGRSTDLHHEGEIIADLPSRAALVRASSRVDPNDRTLVFSLVAWGRRDDVLHPTHDRSGFAGMATTSENKHDGVCWYRWPQRAFGFSSDPSLYLYYADSGVIRGHEEVRPEDRLSWNLERESTGGWRAGCAYNLGSSSEWLKCLYYRM